MEKNLRIFAVRCFRCRGWRGFSHGGEAIFQVLVCLDYEVRYGSRAPIVACSSTVPLSQPGHDEPHVTTLPSYATCD